MGIEAVTDQGAGLAALDHGNGAITFCRIARMVGHKPPGSVFAGGHIDPIAALRRAHRNIHGVIVYGTALGQLGAFFIGRAGGANLLGSLSKQAGSLAEYLEKTEAELKRLERIEVTATKLRIASEGIVRGNHESFSEDVSKGGTPQGLLWKRALKKARTRNYRRAMQRYYDLLPFAVKSPHFCATHAAPATSKISAEKLIDIHQYPELCKGLVSNRMRRGDRPGGYTKGDVKRFRRALGLASHAPFIVGHTPLDSQNCYWLDVGGVKGHHVLYSAGQRWVGVMTQIGGEMVALRYPAEPLIELVNGLGKDEGKVREERVA